MKIIKLLSLVLLTLIFFSCSSDDDNLSPESLIGTWKPIKEVDVCSNKPDEVSEYSLCRQKSRVIFNSNGSVSETTYGVEGKDCLFQFKESSTWAISNNTLSIVGFGNIDYFRLSGNILKIGKNDNEFCADGYYYTEYVRVE